MKQLLAGIMLTLVLTGCSLGDVSESINYVNNATEHINELSNFAETAPEKIQQAASDPEVKKELKNDLKELKSEIQTFNKIEAPDMAKDIHQSLVNKNEEILAQINQALEDGNLAIDKIQNSEIIQTIRETNDLLNRLQNLGG